MSTEADLIGAEPGHPQTLDGLLGRDTLRELALDPLRLGELEMFPFHSHDEGACKRLARRITTDSAVVAARLFKRRGGPTD
jgi:hypothetical protein